MGESFTIQISSNLVRHLLDDGEKVKKKTRKSKPKTQHSETVHHPKTLAGPISTGWPIQPPLYIPPPPPPKPANAELDAILSVLETSEKVVERLQKQEENMFNEVTQRAKDLHDKEFKLPSHKPIPCLDERNACLKCYKENVVNPLKCAQLVEGFAECARWVRERPVGADNN